MLASLLRPRKPRIRADRSPFSSPNTAQENTPFFRRGTHLESDAEDNEETDEDFDRAEEENDEDDEQEDPAPLLPIFSAPYLGWYLIGICNCSRQDDVGSRILTNYPRCSARI